MKKNTSIRIGAIVMALVLMTLCLVSGTLAKYVTSANASDSARVAKFGVTVTASTTDGFKATYATDDAAKSATITNSVVASTKVIAPGTTGTIASFTVAGTPEVAVSVAVDASASSISDNWKDAGANAYMPVTFTLEKDGTAVAGAEDVDFATLKTSLDALSNVYNSYDLLSNPRIEITSKSSATIQFYRSYINTSEPNSQNLNFYSVSYTSGGPQNGIETDFSLPSGLKITMVNRCNSQPVYYYYFCDGSETELSLTDFIKMGTLNEHYSVVTGVETVGSTDYLLENYLFVFDFGSTVTDVELNNFRVTLTTKDSSDNLINTQYAISSSGFALTNTSTVYNFDASLDKSTYQSKSIATINAAIESNLGGAIDTTKNGQSLGMCFTLSKEDEHGNYVDIDFPKGISFIYADRVFQPEGENCVVAIANYIASTQAVIDMNMLGYTALTAGEYMLTMQLVGVSGYHNDLGENEFGVAVNRAFTIRNDEYAIDIDADNEKERLVYSNGETTDGSNSITFTLGTWKTEGADDPVTVATFYKKNAFGNYEQVPISEILSGWSGTEMYLNFTNGASRTIPLISGIVPGTYRVMVIARNATDASRIYATDYVNIIVKE